MNTINTPSNNPSLPAQAGFFDTIVLWKILVMLGYLTPTPDLEELFTIDISDAVDLPQSVAKRLIKDVTDAINRTHL